MNRRKFLETVWALASISWLSGCRSSDPAPPPTSYEPHDPANHKKRSKVLHVHHFKATAWDYQTGNYIDAIDGAVVYTMITQGLMQLTGTTSLKAAWRKLLKDYQPDHRIVIKPNLNNTEIGYGQAIMTSPQVISGVVRSLIEADIPPNTITLYDLSARVMPEIAQAIEPYGIRTVWRRDPESFFDKIALRFEMGEDAPDTNAVIRMRKPVTTQDGTSVTCYLPKVLTKAHHLINLPVFKAHQFILHSNALKNHFGTVRYSNHHQFPVILHGPHIESHIVDINAHPIIAGRTRLVMVDALFGAPLFTRGNNGRIPTKWRTFPQGPTPNSLFFSTDPLAIESVTADFVIAEQRKADIKPHSYAYLQDAMNLGLGNYEHRDAVGQYKDIDYIQIDQPTQNEAAFIPSPQSPRSQRG